jgi:hypothetical protein
MTFRPCQDDDEHRIEVKIGRDGAAIVARADVQPLGDADEHWFADGGDPAEILRIAQKEAMSRGIPLCVRLDPAVAWRGEWETALQEARGEPGKAAPL